MTDEARQEQQPEKAKGAMDRDLVLSEEEQEGVKGGGWSTRLTPLDTTTLPTGGGG